MIDRTEILNCLPTFFGDSHHCMTCFAPVPDFEPEICCDGTDCPCNGLPLEPCFCPKCKTISPPVSQPPIGELTSTQPRSNSDRLALYHYKRGETPFYRVWLKGGFNHVQTCA